MLLQAAGLALIAALNPSALLAVAVYLGSARPRQTAALFLAGAVTVSVVAGVGVLVVVQDAGLNIPTHHAPRYGLRLGLGVLLVAAGIVVALRKPRQADPAIGQGIVSRMIANPTPRGAFFAGILVFASAVSFLAAVQVIATARSSLELTVVALIVVVAINVALAWSPIVLYLAAPAATTRYLTAFNGWLRVHGRTVSVWVLVVAGGIVLGDGIYGLAVVR